MSAPKLAKVATPLPSGNDIEQMRERLQFMETALLAIALEEKETSNATVRRMASMAKDAICYARQCENSSMLWTVGFYKH